MTDLNYMFDALADAQRIPVGSPLWEAFGPAVRTGSTGPHGSYGWKHHHRLTDEESMRAVIANYASRRIFYPGELYRAIGGRPEGAMRTDPDGLDLEHAWLEPLWALIDLTPSVPVWNLPARWIATEHVSAIIGQLRNVWLPNPDHAVSWTFSDRAASRILSTIVEAHARDCIKLEDAKTAAHWIENAFLPFCEKSPGLDEFVKGDKGVSETYRISVYNGLCWRVPVLWNATRSMSKGGLPSGEVKDRLRVGLKRMCQWAADLLDHTPDAFRLEAFHIANPEPGAPPHETIAGKILKTETMSSNVEPWCYRAVSIAAQVLDSSKLRHEADDIHYAFMGDPEQAKWLVGAEEETR